MCDARQISTRGVSQGVQRHVLAWATRFGSTVGAHSGLVPTVFERLTHGRRTSSRRPGTDSGPTPGTTCGLGPWSATHEPVRHNGRMSGPVPSSASVSARMSRQGSRDTAPEIAVRRLLHASGLRYRVNVPVPGMARRTVDVAE